MADRQARDARRGGGRGFQDESNRRDKHGRDERYGRDNRDRDHDRDRRRDRDRGDERDRNRDRNRDRDRDRDHRRHRSKSPNRRDTERDRRRSQSPRNNDRREDRPKDRADRDRGYRSRRDEGRDNVRDRNGGKEVDKGDRQHHDNNREQGIGAFASPRPPPSPKQQQSHLDNESTSLPSRSKPSEPQAPVAASTPPAHVSFKVKGREGSHPAENHRPYSRGQSQEYDDGRYQNQADEEDHSRGRFDADPMDRDDEEELVVEDDGLEAMQAMMGFGGFDSTKGKKIKGNNLGAVHKEKKTEYRQYMNRVGGFNRPLSPGR
ncbi:Protein of unknown function (DUF1777) domain containing protein [Rhypophila decipiens]